jgi:hypothetical protein
MTKRLILALLLSCSPLWATTYYVDNCVVTGNDSNRGTSTSTPWLTIAKVNASTFAAGDSILFQSTCTWREQLTIASSGTSGNSITFGAYGTGALPIISGATLLTSWVPEAQAGGATFYYASDSVAPASGQVFRDKARLLLAGTKNTLEIGGYWWDSVNSRVYVYDNPTGHMIEASYRNYAVYSTGKSYITVQGIEADMAQLNGLYFSNSPGGNILVQGVTVQYSAEDGAHYDSCPSSVFSSVTADYNGADGIGAYNSAGLVIELSTAHHNAQLGTVNYTAGIKLAPSTMANVTIQYNVSYSNGLASSGATRGAGIWADTIAGGGLVTRYNLSYSNYWTGIHHECDANSVIAYNVSWNNGQDGLNFSCNRTPGVTGNQMYNNTSYGNLVGIAVLGPSAAGMITNNLIENNISVNNRTANLKATGGGENDGTNGSENVYRYNGFGPQATNFIEWGTGVYESTYTTWETATGNCGRAGCSNSVQSAPAFANASAGQFWLTSGSPGIDAGLNLGSPYNIGLMPGSTWPNSVVTGDQNAYGSGWEMGAFVYVPPVALHPPSNLLVLSVH